MVLKELILTISTMGGSGGLERSDFNLINETGSAENKVRIIIKSLTSFHWHPC